MFDDQTQSFPIDFISLLPTGDDSEGVFLELPTDTFPDEALTSVVLADGAPILPGFSGLLDGVDALNAEFSSIRVALVPLPASLPLLASAFAGLAFARGYSRHRNHNTGQESTP
ncbi:MAG: VPLPA-CTERM sorting domain-containing protein [Pseudomonadota bacterium]